MKRSGFTLVEMVVSVALLALLAGAVLVVLSTLVRDAERLASDRPTGLPPAAMELLERDLVQGRDVTTARTGVRVIDDPAVFWVLRDGLLLRVVEEQPPELVATGVTAFQSRVDGGRVVLTIDVNGQRTTRRMVLR